MKQIFMQKTALRQANVQAEDVPAPRCHAGSVLLANRYSLISAGTETTAVGSNKRDMVLKALRDAEIRQGVVDMLTQDGIRKTADRVQFEMTKWTPLGYSGAGVAVDVGREIQGIHRGELVAYGGQGHAELIHAQKNLCASVPDGVSAREAAFVALGSIALQAVRRAEVEVGDTVAVMGLGLVGQLVSQILQASGARVLGTDVISARIETAEALGLEAGFRAGDRLPEDILRYTKSTGVDRVLICASTHSRQVVEQAVAMARDRGRIVVVGMVNLDVPRQQFYMKELDLVISRSYGPGRYDRQYEEHGVDYPMGYVRWTEQRNMQEFLRLIQSEKLNVSRLITHEFSLDEAEQGYELLMNQPTDCLAVLLRYDEKTNLLERRVEVSKRRPKTISGSRVNIAVFGCGAFARQFHLPNLKRSKVLNLSTLVTASGQSAKEMAVRYGAERCTTDSEDVWTDPSIDAVMIFTRDKNHTALATAALNAGKHVFCEKPLATSYEECRTIAAKAANSQLLCMTGFNRRFAPLLRRVKDIVDSFRGPKIVHYRVNAGSLPHDNWVYDPADAEGRIVGEACHFVDLFCWLIGDVPVKVSAQALGTACESTKLEDVVSTFEFADGSVASLIYTAQGATSFPKERLEIFCDGTAVAMDDYQILTVRGSERLDVRHRRADKGHSGELRHFAAAIAGQEPPMLEFDDGIRASWCCLKLIESARQGEAVDIRCVL